MSQNQHPPPAASEPRDQGRRDFLEQGVRLAGGAVVFFAVPGPKEQVVVPLNAFWTQEIRILTSYYCGPPDIEASMRLLAAREIEVEPLITHRLPL